MSPVRRRFYGDDLAVLPRQAYNIRWGHEDTDEWGVVFHALEMLAKHAAEAGDARMAGRCMAAVALIGQNVSWLWEDCLYLFPAYAAGDGGETVRAQAYEFFVSGVRRRPARLLRAEAHGMVYALRWLARVGLLTQRDVMDKSLEPFTRSPEGQRRQRFYIHDV